MKIYVRDAIGLTRLTLLPALLCAVLCAEHAKAASFVETGSAGTGRFVGTATLLSNGQVLMAGGGVNPIFSTTATTEIYNPATHAWSFVGSMSVPRIAHSAVLLQN